MYWRWCRLLRSMRSTSLCSSIHPTNSCKEQVRSGVFSEQAMQAQNQVEVLRSNIDTKPIKGQT